MAFNGNSVILEFSQEENYGEYKAPTTRLAVSSESLGAVYNKASEGLLTGGIGGSMVDTMSAHTEGSINTLAKPYTFGFIAGGLLGKEKVSAINSDNKYAHRFTCVGNGIYDHLPSFSFSIDRMVNQLKYTGVKFGSVSFSAQAEDRLSMEISLNGQKEDYDAVINKNLKVESNKAFKFHQGGVYLWQGDTKKKLADVSSVSMDINNNLDTSLFVAGEFYAKEAECGTREASAQLEVIYGVESEEIRRDYFKTDAVISLEIEFVDADKNKVIFEIPHAQIQEMQNATATGNETMKQSLTVNAVDLLDGDFIAITLENDYPDPYLLDGEAITD